MLDIAGPSPYRAMLECRKAALERRAFRILPSVAERERCDPETWALISGAVRARDSYHCQGCGTNAQVAVHHIVPVASGGSDDPQNLITLCKTCHARIHPWLNGEESNG